MVVTISEPVSTYDYYSKSSVSKFILEKSPTTFANWEKEGKVFPPRHSKNGSVRKHYSLADAMRISIMFHGSIHMDKIYSLTLNRIYGEENELSYLMLGNSVLVKNIKLDIRKSFMIIKNQIVSNDTSPVDLSSYLIKEPLEEISE